MQNGVKNRVENRVTHPFFHPILQQNPLSIIARGTPTMSRRVIVLAVVALLWTMPVRGAESGVCYDCLCRIKELGFYVDLPEGYDCTPPPPPSPPPSPPSPPPPPGPSLAMIYWDFSWDSADLSDRAQHCVDKTLTHHPYDESSSSKIVVTCCHNEVDVTSDNVHRPECYDATSPWDYDAAAAMCASYNSVICTSEQLRAGLGNAKGCNFDFEYHWARDAC